MSGGFLFSIGIMLAAFFFKTPEYITILQFPLFLFSNFALFGLFHSIANNKSQEGILWSYLGGIFISSITTGIQSIWLNIDTFRFDIEFIKLINIFSVFLIPTIAYSVLYTFQNYADNKHKTLTHDSIFKQNILVDKRMFTRQFPVIFLILIALIRSSNFRLFHGVRRIISSDLGFLERLFSLTTGFISLVLFCSFFIFAVNFMIRRFKTLRKNISWTYLLSFVPVINLFPYFSLKSEEKKTTSWDTYVSRSLKNKENLKRSLISFYTVLFIILILINIGTLNGYGANVMTLAIIESIVKYLFVLGFLQWLSQNFTGFWVILGIVISSVLITHLSGTKNQYIGSLLQYAATSIFVWYVIAKAFNVDWSKMEGEEEDEIVENTLPIIEGEGLKFNIK